MPSTLTPSFSRVRWKVGTTENTPIDPVKRGRAGEDLIGGGRNVVAAGRRIAAHGDDDGLAGFAQRLHFAQDLLRGEHAAARAVDAQHHRLDGVVVARLAQQIGGALAADRARRLMAVENLAGGDHDADLGVGFGFQHALGAHRREILIHPDGVEGMRVLVLAHQALQFVGQLAAALQARSPSRAAAPASRHRRSRRPGTRARRRRTRSARWRAASARA